MKFSQFKANNNSNKFKQPPNSILVQQLVDSSITPNEPSGDGGLPIEWNGKTTGLPSYLLMYSFLFYKVSSCTLTENDLIGTTIKAHWDGTDIDGMITREGEISLVTTDRGNLVVLNSFVPLVFVISNAGEDIVLDAIPFNFSSTGVWFMYGNGEHERVFSIKSVRRSYYSQAENPNPISFSNSMLNMSFYKVSDLIPTREEIFNGTQLFVNGTECFLTESGIQLETDDFIYMVESSGSFIFVFVNKVGTLNFNYYVENIGFVPMSLDVTEAGIYYQRALNAGVPAGRTIEFIIS